MKMKIYLSALALLLAVAFPAFCQDEFEPQLDFPTPPGATIVMQMDVTRDQLLSQLEFMSSTFLGSDRGPKLDLRKIKDALQPLQRVEFAQMSTGGNYSTEDIVAVFEKSVGGKRILYNVADPGRAMLMLATPDGKGYFGALITSETSRNGNIVKAKIQAARTFGFPDLAKLVAMLRDPAVVNLIMRKGR